MKPEQLLEVRVGQVLICTEGNQHFELGSEYKVRPHDKFPEYLVIECDEGNTHFIDKLNPAHWKLKEEAKVESDGAEERALVWELDDILEKIDDDLLQFTKDHPEFKVVKRLNFHDNAVTFSIRKVQED